MREYDAKYFTKDNTTTENTALISLMRILIHRDATFFRS